MIYYFSPKNDAFYPEPLKDSYVDAGTWPDDGVEVTEVEYLTYTDIPPEGKVRGVIEGAIAWVDAPPPSTEQLIALAESNKSTLLSSANSTISDWQTELLLGIISDDDKEKLIEWMKYIKLLKQVDTSLAPNIDWPVLPK